MVRTYNPVLAVGQRTQSTHGFTLIDMSSRPYEPFDLSDAASVELTMEHQYWGETVVEGESVTIPEETAEEGYVEYQFSRDETRYYGTHYVQFAIEWSDGSSDLVPPEGSDWEIHVGRRLPRSSPLRSGSAVFDEASIGTAEIESLSVSDRIADLDVGELDAAAITGSVMDGNRFTGFGGGFTWDGGQIHVAIDDFGSVEGLTIPMTQNLPLSGYDVEGPGDAGTLEDPLSTTHSEEVRVTGDGNITVTVPSDYPTVNAAVAAAGEYQPKSGAVVEVVVEEGHEITEPISVWDGYFGYIRLSTDADNDELALSSDFPADSDVIYARQAHAPRLGFTIDAGGVGGHGVHLENGSKMWVLPPGGVINAGAQAARIRTGSTFVAPFSRFHGATDEGLDAMHGCVVSINRIDLSGAGVDCLRAARGCLIDAGSYSMPGGTSTDLSGAGQDAVRVSRSCFVDVYRADLRDAGRHAIRTTRFSTIGGRQVAATGSTDDAVWITQGASCNVSHATLSTAENPSGANGIYASGGATVSAPDATIDNCAGHAAHADSGAMVVVKGASATNAGNTDLHVSDGGMIAAANCTTTASPGGIPHVDDCTVAGIDTVAGLTLAEFEG